MSLSKTWRLLQIKAPDEHSKGCGLRFCWVLYLLVEVGLGELQRVEQSVGRRQLDVVARLLLPHALDDGCQDLVGVLLQLLGILQETNGYRDLLVLVLVRRAVRLTMSWQMYPMASSVDSFMCSVLDGSVTLATSWGISSGHCLTGISAHAIPATHCDAELGRYVSVPRVCKT